MDGAVEVERRVLDSIRLLEIMHLESEVGDFVSIGLGVATLLQEIKHQGT